MMRDSLARIFLALAGTNTTRAELREFVEWVDANGLERTADILQSLRSASASATQEYGRDLFSEKSFETARRISEKQLVTRIEKLLLESGLTKAATVKATTDLLKERGHSPKSIPDANKISFRDWVAKLLREIPPDELLKIASIVRNYAVHGIDWPLRREKP